jgi:Carboxypeptidase regulatory-like domain/TonB dependent receptor
MRRLLTLPTSLFIRLTASFVVLQAGAFSLTYSQSNAVLKGRVVDQNSAVVARARISAREIATGWQRIGETDAEGNYQIAALPVGNYRVEAQAQGFRTKIVDSVKVEVARIVVLDFRLEVGNLTQTINVASDTPLVETATVSVGQVISERTVQEIPLNGRYLTDLALLTPGSVTPPQNGFLSPPTRGGGSLGLNTAGNREDTVNFQINGITINDQLVNLLLFNPPLTSIREFKIDNSTFSAEYGRSSGAIINVATRSGTQEFHGELYEFFRNDALDTRNFFNFTSARPPPFKRNQFGGAIGGPIYLPRFGEGGPVLRSARDRAFFFFNYDVLRQRQGVDLNSLVLSDTQRASVTDPVIRKLIELIPRANFLDSTGTPRFVGSAPASADVNQWTMDISYNHSERDRLHAYYVYQRTSRTEPNIQGNTIPGFGNTRVGFRQLLTLNETHIVGPNLVNEMRLGFNRIYFTDAPDANLNPIDFGINNGVNSPIGLPQINIAGGLNLGGPSQIPQGRGDTTMVFSDTVSYLRGRHSLKFGGDYRQFYNNNFTKDTGLFNFPSVAAFIAGNANSFSITLDDRVNSIKQDSLGFFVQDNFKWRPSLTLELGLRYDLNLTPTERYDRFIVFDPQTASLLRVGRDIDQVYRTNHKNFQPRVGMAWDPFGKGTTSLRAGYAILVEQPMTDAVFGTSINPPLARPLTFTGTVRLDNAINLAQAAGNSLITVDHNYENAYVQSWNLNVQRQLLPDLAVMIGYFGSKGTHLRISRNLNQPLNGVRPFPRLSTASPQLPGALIGNITQVEGTGNSSYNALWVSATKRFSHGLQFNASYTLSKSIDYNSLSSPPTVVTVQNSYDLRADRGLSDFDARHRFVASAIYELPFTGNRIKDGWQFSTIVQSQSGNPVNIITSNSTINGVANTLRPDVAGPVAITGALDHWFDTSAFTPVARFGNLGRNVIIGPSFNNVDFSLLKNLQLKESMRLQMRAEVFDFLNHASFGQPGRVVGSQNFGRISNTRFPTGDSGSSRQMQFVFKFLF